MSSTKLKLTKEQSSKLDCLCGICDHDCLDKSCAFNKIMASMHPEETQKEMFLKWVSSVIASNIEKSTRATMKTNKKK